MLTVTPPETLDGAPLLVTVVLQRAAGWLLVSLSSICRQSMTRLRCGKDGGSLFASGAHKQRVSTDQLAILRGQVITNPLNSLTQRIQTPPAVSFCDQERKKQKQLAVNGKRTPFVVGNPWRDAASSV